MVKKFIASILLSAFILLNVGPTVINAQTWYFQDYTDWHARVYDDSNPDEIFGERYTAAQVEWVIYGLAAFVINHMVGDGTIISCIIENALDEDALIAACAPIIGPIIATFTYNVNQPGQAYAVAKNPIQDILSGERPISGIGYLRNAASKFNLVSEVKAQGFGFEAASSMRVLWVAVRNITYFFLILLIIVMSFLIMFRFKISPQTVITVQSALPRIIIALLLITFSYALAGFMIDLLYVVIGLVAALLSQSGLFTYMQVSPSCAPYPVCPGDNLSWSDMYRNLSGVGLGQGIFGVMFIYFTAFMVTAFYALSSNVLGFVGNLTGLTQIVTLIIVVVVGISLIVILLKILWMLTKAFVSVLLLTATGPIFIVVGGFGNWLKSLASNLAVFAAVGPMLAIAMLFLASALPNFWLMDDFLASNMPFNPSSNALGNSPWIPPFLPGGGDLDVTWLFASFAIITLIPNVANIIKSMIQGRPFGYGAAIGAALGAGAGIAAYPITSAWGATSQARSKAFTEMIQTRSIEPLRAFFRQTRPCLTENTFMATTKGAVAVQNLKRGAKVWTLNGSGVRISVKILKVVRTAVPNTHIVTHLALENGRELFVSPGHPRGDGYTIGDLRVGDVFNGSRVKLADNIPYLKKFTYDILPAGKTALYWANGMLLGSTLSYQTELNKANNREAIKHQNI